MLRMRFSKKRRRSAKMQKYFGFRKIKNAIECSHGNFQNGTNVSVPQKLKSEKKEASIIHSRKKQVKK